MNREITPELQAAFTNKLLRDFAKGLDQVLKGRLQAIGGKVPNSTISLLSFNIMEASAADISAKYFLYFQDSARHSEMKNLKGGKMLPVEDILEWLTRGRANIIKNIPGYGQKPGNISRAKAMERVAWAIAISRGKKGQRRRGQKLKERQWINKNFYGWYNRLIEDFIVKQGDLLHHLLSRQLHRKEKSLPWCCSPGSLSPVTGG